jgi:small subunit ribosomal protein S12
MPTINQLVRKRRESKVAKSSASRPQRFPQKRGVACAVHYTPKKAQLALRKVPLPVTKGMEVTSYIPAKATTFRNTLWC